VLAPDDAQDAISFKNKVFASGLMGKHRVLKYEIFFKNFAGLLHKPFNQANKDDLERVVLQVRAREDWQPQTKSDFLKELRRYYTILNGGVVPPLVAWIHIKSVEPKPLAYEDTVQWDDVCLMADKALIPRNRAFVTSIWEAGTRIGEHTTLRIKDYERCPHGANLHIWKSKTHVRPVFVRLCVPDIEAWLRIHPLRDDPEAPLFCQLKDPSSVISYEYAKCMLGRLKRNAGIKKYVTPHMLRHGSASYFANYLSDSDMDAKYGWEYGSKTKRRYTHKDEKSVEEKLLALSGIPAEHETNIYSESKDDAETFEEFLHEQFQIEYQEWKNKHAHHS
jgi:integrase/recombinase XerD